MLRYLSVLTLLCLLGCDRIARTDQTAADTGLATPATSPTPAVHALDVSAHKLLPIDQADPSFRAFRAQLLHALAAHDTTFLYSILAPEVRNTFGGSDSLAGFKHLWHLDSGKSPIWTALSRVLQLGGKLTDSTFVAPYVYAFWPDSMDAFRYVAVTNNAAPVRATPIDSATVLGTASYGMLKLSDWKGLDELRVATDSTWALVQLPDGRGLWLEGSEVYSPVGWRAFFMKRDGRWLMTTFVSGD